MINSWLRKRSTSKEAVKILCLCVCLLEYCYMLGLSVLCELVSTVFWLKLLQDCTFVVLQFPFVIAAETCNERDRWLNALQQSSRM